MSTTIEERIVSMQFKGEQFLAGIDKSLAKLQQFNDRLKMTEGTKGFEGVGASANRQVGALSKVADGVQHISDRFKTMGVVGMAAISNVTNQAIFAGQRLVKSLTMEPILQGFREYELNMNSIQTILSNTQAAGTKLSDVTAVLDDLNHYSDQTIYNFAEMAKNIGTFTAAGVALKPAASAIKGIANLAALSGSNSEQASGAMYQLSQAISSGRVSLEDWNSVVNAGMGGTVFQRALAQTAEKIGTLDKGAVKLKGSMKNVSIEGKSFRESVTAKPGEESWLTSEVLTKTLAQFTGDLTDAQLAAEGFNKAEIKAIQQQAKTAKEAATQVKTLTQLMGTLKESAGSGWAQTWKTIFGDFPEAKTLFTSLSNTFGGMISRSADARNKVLADWKALGGRKDLIDGITFAFNNLMEIVTPIGKAFRDIFPRTTGKQLADLSKSFKNLMSDLRLNEGTMDNLRRTFRGVFAVVGIGIDILKPFLAMIGRLVGVAFDGSGGFLDFTAKVGDWLVNLRKAIQEGEGLTNFFKGLGDILEVPIKLIQKFAGFLGEAFKDVDGSKVTESIEKASKALEPMGRLGETIAKAWGKINGVINSLMGKFLELGNWVAEKFGGTGTTLADMFSNINWDDVFKGINTGLFAGLVLMFRKFLGGGGGGGLLDNLNEAIEGLTGALSGMQHALNAAALLAIAVAIGVLAVSMNVLSKIDSAGLAKGTAAMAGLFAQLVGAMLLLNSFTTFKGAASLPLIAASMILMAASITILASAMKKLSELDWEGLSKGLVGVTALMGILVATAHLMPKGASFVLAAASMVIMSAAIKILADSVAELGAMSWEDMTRGLVGVGVLIGALLAFANTTQLNVKGFISGVVVLAMAAAIKTLASALKDVSQLSWAEMARGLAATAAGLAIISGALKLLPPSSLLSAAAIFVVAASLQLIGDALKSFATMSWEEFGKGMAVLAGSLGIIAGALYLMEGALPGAAALIVAAAALVVMDVALQSFAKMSWEEIGKSMTVLAGSLLILSAALAAMSASLPGAAALIVAAAALAILTPVLIALGAMSWEAILKGLAALAGLFLVIGVAGALLTPVIPTLLGLAASIALIGAAVLVAGAGIALFGIGVALLATGLVAIAAAGVAAATAIVGMITVLIGGIPVLVELIGKLLLALLQLVIDVAPKLGEAIIALLDTVLDVIVKESPKIIDTIVVLIDKLVEVMLKKAPQWADAGYKLLAALLNVWAANVGKVVTAATNVIVAFLNGIAKNIPRIAAAATNVIIAFINEIGKNAVKIADAGMKMIVNFVNGLADSVRKNSQAMRDAGKNLAMAIIDGMTGGLASGVGRIADKAKDIARGALDAAKGVLGIHSPSKEFEKIGKFVNEGFAKGLDGSRGTVDAAFTSMNDQLKAAMRNSADSIKDLTEKLKKLNSARKKDYDEIKKTKAALAQANKERQAEARALAQVQKYLATERRRLSGLADQQAAIAEKLETANKTLEDAIKTRDDYNKSIDDQYNNLPDISGEDTTLASYVADLRKQIEDTQIFASAIQKLRDLGLSDELYKELLAKGPSALPFINDVLAAGKDGVNELNKLTGQLGSVSDDLGDSASKALYQAGVDAAEGLVKGLQAQHDALEKEMDWLAAAMLRSLKKSLGIKSPSKEFMKIAKFSVDGLAEGFKANSKIAAKSAESLANVTTSSLRKSMSIVPDILTNMDTQPTIRPVLDLTEVRRGMTNLGGMLPRSARISVGGTYASAKFASAGYQANKAAVANASTVESGATHQTNLNYTQNNNSPKALSNAEIYRQTKNQLSVTKGAVDSANFGGS